MKRFSSITVVAIASVYLAAGAAQPQHPGSAAREQGAASAHTPAQSGPANVKVEFENDKVVVLRVRMEVHERTPLHDVTPRVVVWLTPAQLRDTSADGRSTVLHRLPGAAEWVSAQRHAGENLGNAPIEFLAIVPK